MSPVREAAVQASTMPLGHGDSSRFLDMFRRIKVGLAGTESHDVSPLSAQLGRLGCDGKRWRWFDNRKSLRGVLHALKFCIPPPRQIESLGHCAHRPFSAGDPAKYWQHSSSRRGNGLCPAHSWATGLLATDPAVAGGALAFEAYAWYSSAALMEVTPLHKRIDKTNR